MADLLADSLHEKIKPFYHKRGPVGILLIHGFTATPYIFQEIGQELANEGYSVIAPLLAGHGTRPEDLGKTTWKDWYRSVQESYDELAQHTHTIFVIGASFGGNLACYLATEKPVQGLILIGIPRWIYKHRLATFFTPILSLARVPFYHKQWGRQARAHKNELLGGPVLTYRKIPIKSVQQFLHFTNHLTDPILVKVKVPTLIIQSSNDGLVQPRSGTHIFRQLASDHKELIWITDRHEELHNGKNRLTVYKAMLQFIKRWEV